MPQSTRTDVRLVPLEEANLGGMAHGDTADVFARWLRSEMPRRGYKLGPRAGGITRLAARTGLGKASISRFVHGQAVPDVTVLRAIGGALGIPLGEMLVHAGLARREEIGEAESTGVPHLQIGRPGDPNPWEVFPDFGDSTADPDRSYEIDIWRDLDRPWQERAADIEAIRDGIGGIRNKWERVYWFSRELADAPREFRLSAIRGLREAEQELHDRQNPPRNDQAHRKGA